MYDPPAGLSTGKWGRGRGVEETAGAALQVGGPVERGGELALVSRDRVAAAGLDRLEDPWQDLLAIGRLGGARPPGRTR